MLEPKETDELPPPPRRFPWAKVILLGLAAALLAGLIAWVNTRGSAEEELRALKEQLDHADPGWRFEDIQAQRPKVPDEQNGALVVIAFKKALPREWGKGQEPLDEFKRTDPRQPRPPEQRVLMERKLREARFALVEARKLAGYSTGRFPININPDMISTLLPDSQDCHTNGT